MELHSLHLKRLFYHRQNECLLSPPRHRQSVFVLGCFLLPLLSSDPYLLRILVLTSIFPSLRELDLLPVIPPIEFWARPLLGVGAYGAAMLTCMRRSPLGRIPLGAAAAVVAGLIVGIPALGSEAPISP